MKRIVILALLAGTMVAQTPIPSPFPTGGSGGGGSSAFSAITAGTNAAALVMGTGGSLTVSGSGTINATSLGGDASALIARLAGPSLTGIVGVADTLLGTDISTPANPAASHTKLYAKGGVWCSLSPAGVENCLGPQGSVGEIVYNTATGMASSPGLSYNTSGIKATLVNAATNGQPAFEAIATNAFASFQANGSATGDSDALGINNSVVIYSDFGAGGMVIAALDGSGPVRLIASPNYELSGELVRVNASGVIGIGPFPSLTTMDLGFKRTGAGAIEFNTGTAGTLADVTSNSLTMGSLAGAGDLPACLNAAGKVYAGSNTMGLLSCP